MGIRQSISVIHGLVFLLIPTLVLAQPVSVTSSIAKKVRYTTTLPSTCVAGEIYADSNATSGQQFYICESADTWVLQGDGGGSAVGWTDDGTEIRLDTSTDEVEIGSAATLSAKFAVNGDTDAIQSLIQGNAAQTANIFVYERSDGTDVMTGSTTGALISQNFAVATLVSCDTIDTNADGVFRCGNDGGSGSGAPTDADYLVGTTNASLSAEIVVGTTPGGELGNTWASPTLDDSVTVTGWVLGTSSATSFTSPTLLTDLIDGVGAVDIDLGSADITDFTVVTDGGTVIIDGNITQDAGTTLFMGGLLDATGAVDMDYGSVDITDHTFIADGTTDADFVVPLTSIGGAEIVTGDISATQLGTDSVSADELNATGVEAELEAALDIDGEVSSTGMATTVLDETGIALTSITIGALLGVDSIDATGAVDMDYGSADINDQTFVTDSTGDAEI